MRKNIVLIFAIVFSIGAFGQNAPMALWGSGLDGSTYQKTVIYSDITNGLLFEAPLNPSGAKLNIEFNWRGSGIPPLLINGNNGFVGIGTKSPNRKLTISDETWGGTNVSNLFALKRQYGEGVVFGAYVGEYITDSYGFTISQRLEGQAGISETFRINNKGNVGIGNTLPLFNLSTSNSGVIATSIIRLQNSYLDNKGLFGVQLCGIDNGTDGHDLYIQGRTTSTGPFSNLMRVKNNGNIGFNTSDIEAWNSSYSAIEFPASSIMYQKNGGAIYYNSNVYYDATNWFTKVAGYASQFYLADGNIGFRTSNVNHAEGGAVGFNTSMLINRDGNVGIGTTNPGEFKLAVAGKIHATEIQVDALPWPDFVFQKDYNLRTLAEVEVFVNQNQHLPDVPSKAEVAEQGISLGEMNAVLLQKIEELTLYVIEQEKKIEKVEAENAELKTMKAEFEEIKQLITLKINK